MNEKEILEKLQEAQNDKAFVEELKAQTTVEGLQSVLKSKGIDLTTEQVEEAVAVMNDNSEQELDQESLENVAGGLGLSVISAGKMVGALLKVVIPTIKPVLKKGIN